MWKEEKTTHVTTSARTIHFQSFAESPRLSWPPLPPEPPPPKPPRPLRSSSSSAEGPRGFRSEEHTSELQSLMRTSYAVFCLKKKKTTIIATSYHTHQHIHTSKNEST